MGGVHTTPFLTPPTDPQHIYQQLENRQEAVVTGTILKAPEIGLEKSRLILDAESLQFIDRTVTVSGKIRLSMPGSPLPDISPGDRVLSRVKLSRPRSFGVPGVFDYGTFLTYRDIWASGWISSPYLIQKVQKIQKPSTFKKLSFITERIRQKINNSIQASLPAPLSGIYKAILTGDRSSVTPEILEKYKATGVIHLLAISGMHMGILSLGIGFIVIWCLKRSERLLLKWPVIKSAAVISLLPLAFYAFIAGLGTPVFRALIMAYVFMGAILFNRQRSTLNNIAAAALILLTINPVELFTASFQLSFTAVIAIALIYPKLSTWLKLDFNISNSISNSSSLRVSKKFSNVVLAGISLSLAASLGTAPLLSFHFNRISLISSISTLLVEPFLCLWSLFIGLVACIFLPFQAVSGFFFKIGSIGILISNLIVDSLSKLSLSNIWTTTPTYLSIFIYYFLLILFFSTLTKPFNDFPKKRAKAIRIINKYKKVICSLIFLLIIIVTAIYFQNRPSRTNLTSVSVLDVGQGLASVIEFPSGKTFVIDGGKAQAGKKGHFNVGRDIIAPFLWKKRISKLDGIIISHPHSDHYNGLTFLTKHFKPTIIWANIQQAKNPSLGEYNKFLKYAKMMNIPINIPGKNQLLYEEDNNYIKSITELHNLNLNQPDGSASRKKDAFENNKGLVIKLIAGKKNILFPGDIEREAEELLLIEKADIKSDALIAPHHGSITSSTNDFMKKIAGQHVVISADINKWGKFPSKEVLDNYIKAGYSIWSTGKSGTIFIETDGDNLAVRTYY